MAKMTHSVMAAVAIGLLVLANAAIVWDTTYGKSPARRLALGLVNSHNDTNDTACIVGGYDPDYPTRIYVGGPCSLIENGVPQTGFRWVVMETLDATLAGTDGSEADMVPHTYAGSSFAHSADYADYAEAGAGMSMHFPVPSIQNASLFLSTTSYLAKADFGFTQNNFVIGVDANNASNKRFIEGVCVQACPGTTPVTCSSCPTEQISVTKGMYKYSIIAAAWNYDTPTTQGWEKIVETYGAGTPKVLSGYLNVYQAIDFTNMNADSLTVTATDDTSVTYAQMDPCNIATFKSAKDSSRNCTVYSVKAVLVESDGWKGNYAFPLTFNVGSWSMASDTAPVVPDMEGTRTVVIRCVRPSADNLVSAGMTATSKAVYLEYKFDVSGITAGSTSGKYVVYDPTVTSGSGSGSDSGSGNAAAGTTSATSGSGSGSGNSGTTSTDIACEPAAAFFTTMFLVAFSGFM